MSHRKPAVLPAPKPVFLLSTEVESYLRISKRTLLRMIHGYTREDGRRVRAVLPFVRRGGRLLFPKSVVDAYVANRTVAA
jgi:hypothetical protein